MKIIEAKTDVENGKITRVMKGEWTKEEAETQKKNMESQLKGAREHLKQLEPILKSPDFLKWQKNFDTYRMIEAQKTYGVNLPEMKKTAQEEIDTLEKDIKELNEALKKL